MANHDHENLDGQSSAPESTRAEFLESLKTAQDGGDVKKHISKQSLEKMLQIWVRDGYADVGDLVHDHFPELLHEDLDEPITDPESIRAEFLESLRTAQDEGSVRRRINKQRVEEMLKIQARDEYYSIENLIHDHFPELLTQSGKRQLEEDDRLRRKHLRTGEFAPSVKVEKLEPMRANEPPATAKQITYLRDLGVRDEQVLRGIGKWQASDLIDTVLKLREDKLDDVAPIESEETPEDSSSAPTTGPAWIVVIIIAVLFAVFVGLS